MWLLGLLCALIGMGIGGSFAWLFKGLQHKIDIIYAICAGSILGLICMEILPEAIHIGGWFITLVGLKVGVMAFYLLHNRLHHNQKLKSMPSKQLYMRTGLLLLLSISIHNLPMGIILGASQENDFSVLVLQTLLFHSIPEGILLGMPLMMAGVSMFRLFRIFFFVSLPVAIGVYIGELIGVAYLSIFASVIGFTVGMMFMVTITEILFPSLKKSPAFNIVVYTLVGFGVMGIYLKLL